MQVKDAFFDFASQILWNGLEHVHFASQKIGLRSCLRKSNNLKVHITILHVEGIKNYKKFKLLAFELSLFNSITRNQDLGMFERVFLLLVSIDSSTLQLTGLLTLVRFQFERN